MGVFINNKRVKDVYINNKLTKQVYINNKPVWLYKYIATSTSWSKCSPNCGDGTQELKFKCYRFDNTALDNQTQKPVDYCGNNTNYFFTKSGSAIATSTLPSTHTDTTNVRTFSKYCTNGPCSATVYIYTGYDDQHMLKYVSNNTTGKRVTIYNNTSGNKHNDKYHYDGNYTFDKPKWPIRFIFHGYNTSNKGGPCNHQLIIQYNGHRNILFPNGWYNDYEADIYLYFELNEDGTITKKKSFATHYVYTTYGTYRDGSEDGYSYPYTTNNNKVKSLVTTICDFPYVTTTKKTETITVGYSYTSTYDSNSDSYTYTRVPITITNTYYDQSAGNPWGYTWKNSDGKTVYI